MDVITTTLKELELFSGLSPLQLTEIARNADRVVFQPGETILTFGEECDAATVIIAGDAVCLRDEADQPTEDVVLPGAILAEMAMVVDIEASATVIAKSRVRAVRIARSAMLAAFEDDPEIAELFLDRITARIRHVADTLKLIEANFDAGPVETEAGTAFPSNRMSPPNNSHRTGPHPEGTASLLH
jgi:CRP-like cAMP-binding protein